MGILGSMIIQSGCIPEVHREVNPFYFFNPVNRTIFKEIIMMWQDGEGIDLITVTNALRDRGVLEQVGGAAYVTELFTFVPTAANVMYYIDIARDKFVLREMIQTGTSMIRAAHGMPEDVSQTVEDFSAKIERLKHAAGGANGSEEFSCSDLRAFDATHDPNTLVGRRWIVRGGAGLWAGGSGYGKSSLVMQLAIYWGCGQASFGLRPVRALKSLIVQAENDRGDMAEQFQGALSGIKSVGDLDLNQCEEMIFKNIGIHRVIGKTGGAFLNLMEQLIELDRPDILWLDPLFAFSGCDLLNPEKTGRFLREGLFPIIVKHNIALNVIHHVGKPVREKQGGGETSMSDIDYQYLGFGTSEIQNAFRSVNILVPVSGTNVYKLVLSKRGERAGAKDVDGHWARSVFLEHSREGICWLQCPEPEKTTGRPSEFDTKVILESMSAANPVKVAALQKQLYEEQNVSRATFYRLFAQLRKEGRVTQVEDGWIKKSLKGI